VWGALALGHPRSGEGTDQIADAVGPHLALRTNRRGNCERSRDQPNPDHAPEARPVATLLRLATTTPFVTAQLGYPAGVAANAEAVIAVGSSRTSNSRTARSANAGLAAMDRYRSVSRVRSADARSAKR
jgi:hypothetical protein